MPTLTRKPPKSTDGITAKGVTCDAVIMLSKTHDMKYPIEVPTWTVNSYTSRNLRKASS